MRKSPSISRPWGFRSRSSAGDSRTVVEEGVIRRHVPHAGMASVTKSVSGDECCVRIVGQHVWMGTGRLKSPLHHVPACYRLCVAVAVPPRQAAIFPAILYSFSVR